MSSYMTGLQLYLHFFYLNWMQRTYSMFCTSGQCISCFILHICIMIFVPEKKRCKMPRWQCAVCLFNQLNCHHISNRVSSICRRCEHSLQPPASLPHQTSTLLNFFKLDTASKKNLLKLLCTRYRYFELYRISNKADQSPSPAFSFLVLLCSVTSNHVPSCSPQCSYGGFIWSSKQTWCRHTVCLLVCLRPSFILMRSFLSDTFTFLPKTKRLLNSISQKRMNAYLKVYVKYFYTYFLFLKKTDALRVFLNLKQCLWTIKQMNEFCLSVAFEITLMHFWDVEKKVRRWPYCAIMYPQWAWRHHVRSSRSSENKDEQ